MPSSLHPFNLPLPLELAVNILFDVVVEPADEDVFVAEALHDVVRLVSFFEQDDLRVLLEGDFLRKTDLTRITTTLIICQIKPKMMCYLFSKMN